MKNILTVKNILAAILAGFVVMFIMITTPKGTEPLSPDGDYTYPDYCIGHESEFAVDKSANSYINHGDVSDAITYVGGKGYMHFGDFELTASQYDETDNSFFNKSTGIGFKLPDGWQAVCGTPKADDNPAYLYDYSAVSPDGEHMLTVKYHNLEADGIKIKNESDYLLYYGEIKTDRYWQAGYKDLYGSNIFVGDMFCSLVEMQSLEKDEYAVEMGRYFLASQRLNEKYVLLIEYKTPYYNADHSVWQNFYTEN